MRLRDRLGHAVAFHVAHAAQVEELLRDRLGHRRAAAEDPLERGDVVRERLRVRQEVHHHRRHVVPVRAAVPLDERRRRERLPAPLDDDRAAGAGRGEETVHEAGDMEEGRRRERDRVRPHVLPGDRAGHVVQHRGVRMHAAFRPARAAGGVGHEAEILRTREGRRRIVVLQPGPSRDHEVIERQAVEAGGHALVRDRHPCAAVLEVVRELGRQVHRPDRHGDRVGAQHGKKRDDEIGPVLQVEQHAVAAPHAAGMLQVPGERVRAQGDLAPRERAPLEHRRGLLGKAPRGLLHRRVQRRARRRQAAGQARRPVREVAGFHGGEV